MTFTRFINGLMDRIFVLVGAFFGSQIPSFMLQYCNRLSGHINELQFQINSWNQMATSSGKALNTYIQKFISNSDPDFSQHGEYMLSMIRRLHDLNLSLRQLQESSVWSRPIVFLTHLNEDIFQATLKGYVPQMTLTLESAFYIILGVIVGFGIYQTLLSIFKGGLRFANLGE